MKIITVGEFKSTGINEVSIEMVIKQWNHLWWIAQWNEEYRIIKYVRKDSGLTDIKLTISEEQANEIIKILNLQPEPGGFRSATSWRREAK